MATTGAGAVHTSTVRTSQTLLHIGTVTLLVADLPGINASSAAYDVWTPTVGGAVTSVNFQAPDEASGTAYTIDSSSTAALLADELGQIDAITQWYNVNATTGALTGKLLGEVGTLTNTTNVTWAHTTTGSEGEDIPVGYAVINAGLSTEPGLDGIHKVALPTTSSETAQVKTFAITYNASGLYVVKVVWNGRIYTTTTIAGNTDSATTATDLATAVNAAMPTESVIASTSTADLILTAEVEGQSFDAWMEVSGSGSAEAAPTYTTGAPGSATTDLIVDLLGIVCRDNSVNDADGDAVIKPYSMCRVLSRGKIIVENSQGVSFGDQVFVSVASGTKGKLYNANSTDYVPIPTTRARWVRDLGNGTAEIELL